MSDDAGVTANTISIAGTDGS
eukprot:SAG22_NODE_4898_length_1137_cov_2.354528_1_plen_20_part_10